VRFADALSRVSEGHGLGPGAWLRQHLGLRGARDEPVDRSALEALLRTLGLPLKVYELELLLRAVSPPGWGQGLIDGNLLVARVEQVVQIRPTPPGVAVARVRREIAGLR
jgi:hypothetical protein